MFYNLISKFIPRDSSEGGGGNDFKGDYEKDNVFEWKYAEFFQDCMRCIPDY